jgi:hypothetical protein
MGESALLAKAAMASLMEKTLFGHGGKKEARRAASEASELIRSIIWALISQLKRKANQTMAPDSDKFARGVIHIAANTTQTSLYSQAKSYLSLSIRLLA